MYVLFAWSHVAHPYVALFASTTPVATLLTALATLWVSKISTSVMPMAFAFSAGTFLYVSITHIVPEIGSNLKAWHLIFMVIGIMLPYFLFIDADHAGNWSVCSQTERGQRDKVQQHDSPASFVVSHHRISSRSSDTLTQYGRQSRGSRTAFSSISRIPERHSDPLPSSLTD